MSLQLHMLWPTHLLSPPEIVLPEGYMLRPLMDGDEKTHVRIMRAAGFGDWTDEKLEMWRWKLALPDGVFVVVHTGNMEVVATAMGSHRPTDLHPSGAELGWVAADPEHCGKGLGIAVCGGALKRILDAGYRRIYLSTDDYRLAAIKTYLNMGFAPFIYAMDMQQRWESVCEKLGLIPDTSKWIRPPMETGQGNRC